MSDAMFNPPYDSQGTLIHEQESTIKNQNDLERPTRLSLY